MQPMAGPGHALPHDGNSAVHTEALSSDKWQTVLCLLGWQGHHLYQGPGRRQHDPKEGISRGKASPVVILTHQVNAC